MARKTMVRIVALAIILILAAGVACFALVTCDSSAPFDNWRANAINTILDKTGLKERVDTALREKARAIAEENGIPSELLETGVDMLDIPNWKAAELPSGTKKDSTFTLDYDGHDITVTTYDDPSYVTLGAFGQEVTFDVPDSAETFTTLAPLLGMTGEVGVDELLTA